MDHNFTPSQLDKTKCARCKWDEVAHSNKAVCETCDNKGPCEIFVDILMCAECLKGQTEYEKTVLNDPIKQEERISALEEQREVDNSVEILTDVFNANTMSIVDIKKAIDVDNSITENKNDILAERLMVRFHHLQDVIFPQLKEALSVNISEQKSIQIYLNDLVNHITVEARKKLQLENISYQPKAPKKESKARAPKVKKFDKVELRRVAAELGIGEFMVQQVCVQKNIQPAKAKEVIMAMIEKGKAASGGADT